MNVKLKLAALAGAAVMVIPGAGLIQNAVAADGTSGSAATEQQAPAFLPAQTQEEQPDRPRPEDCPEKDGQGGGSGSGAGEGASGSTGGADTAL